MEQVTASGKTITLVHFVSYTTDGMPGWRIACMPNMTEFHATPYHPNYQRTDDVRAVSCPACKAAPVFKESQDRLQAAAGRVRNVK